MSGTQDAVLDAPASVANPDQIRLVDVGGAGGVQDKWLASASQIVPILFEPNPAEAVKLREIVAAQFTSGLVVERALSNVAGPMTLNVTRHWGCTSMRQPNPDVLSKYRIAPLFDVVNTHVVECTRYDTLHRAGLVPAPDVIKIDVQGFEYEVLLGFGGLLQTCFGIELETHVYPIYRNQKLLGDMIEFLGSFGFALRSLASIPSFDGDVVELDACFTQRIDRWRLLSASDKRKFSLISRTWNIVDYSRVDPDDHHQAIGSG